MWLLPAIVTACVVGWSGVVLLALVIVCNVGRRR